MPDLIARAPRAPRPRLQLEVLRREQLSPHLVRLHLGGPGFAAFTDNGFTDRYVKIVFGDVTRTYTVRSVEADRGQIAVDFVVHGDEGIAGPWAAAAEPGETVTFSGPGGAYAPDADADWHLFAGDESALPAIAAALEALPAEAVGVAFVEVGGEADEIEVAHPAGLELRWLHRGDAVPGTSGVLAEAVGGYAWREGRVQVFAHGEREAMKALRDVFFVQRGLERRDVSISGYWAYGRTEDRFQAEKREPIGQILS
ncbi:MAG: siderophore-interacting protein [Herbiconiux sp.]|nr:siderophore-interacting protein [Herbiconiux sp.]